MSNVTPKRGQFWNVNGFSLKARHVDNELSIVRFDGGLLYSLSQVQRDFEYIPQNDLEHLAVQYDCWNCNRHLLIARSSDLKGICFVENNDDGLFKNTYTYRELQDMRYELGLDENRREELTSGMIKFDVAPMSEDFKKENNMLDLSNSEVGDKFTTEDKQECVIALKKGYDICFELLDGADLLFITNEAGVPSNANYHHLRIAAKHESHKGLKKFDIVEVVTNPRQEEASLATVLELTEFEGEDAAVIQYHNAPCGHQTVCVCYMEKYEKETT